MYCVLLAIASKIRMLSRMSQTMRKAIAQANDRRCCDPASTVDPMEHADHASTTRAARAATGVDGNTAMTPERTVAAIVVTTEPSPELASTLRALSRQDVPVAILVVDDASSQDPAEVVAEAAPEAFVTRLETVSGWCAAANKGAELVSGAQWLLFCHDDVAPAPDALRSMLDTAEAEHADLIAPKLVAWSDHERLRSVGFSADRSAKAIARVDLNELDQGQHDFVRPTVAVHSACLLVRADLFERIGGFDVSMSAPNKSTPRSRRRQSESEQLRLVTSTTGPERGEDLDLCWRIMTAGGLAVVDPGARVAHAERPHRSPDFGDGEGRGNDPAAEALAALIGRRNRVRTVFSVLHGPTLYRGLAALLFQRLVLLNADLPFPAVRHLVPKSGLGSLLKRRREVAALRSQRPLAITLRSGKPEHPRLESQLSASEITIRRVLRTEVAKDSSQALLLAGEAVSVGWKRGPIRLISGVFLATLLALLVGSRNIIWGVAPHGQFVPISQFGDLLRAYGTSWRDIGTGALAPSPPGLLVAMVSRGAGLGTDRLTSLLTTTLLIPIGLVGAGLLGAAVSRSCGEGPWGPSSNEFDPERRAVDQSTSVLSTVLCAAMYGAAPVAANAIRVGSWEALLLFAALPWWLRSVLAASGQLTARRTNNQDDASFHVASFVRVGLPLGVLAALAPVAGVVCVAAVLLLWLGSLIADHRSIAEEERNGPRRSVVLIAGAAAVAAALLTGWVLELIRTPTLLRGHGPTSPPANLANVMRLTAGPASDGLLGLGGWLGTGLFVAAVLTMLLINARRLWWAVRWWVMAIAFAAAMWCVDRGPVVGVLPSHEVIAVPLALGLVVVVTVGLSGIAQDIRRARFGWRQVAMVTAVFAAVSTVIPVMWSSRHGDWSGTLSDARRSTGWIPDSADPGLFRTVWLGTANSIDGDASTVPGQDAQPSSARIQWNMTWVSPPTIATAWGGSPRTGAAEIANALAQVSTRSTFRVGSVLAPAAVRYVVVSGDVSRASRSIATGRPLDALVSGLEQQLDLREIQRDAHTIVYENTGWTPWRSVDGQPAFVGAGTRNAVIGQLPKGTLRVADTADPGWKLSVDGVNIPFEPNASSGASSSADSATGSTIGVSFVQPGGLATLRHRAPVAWTMARWLQILLWSAASIAYLLDWSSRRRRLDDLVAEIGAEADSDDDEPNDDAWDSSLTVDGAFRSDDDLYAEVFDDHHVGPRRDTVRGLNRAASADPVNAGLATDKADIIPDPGAGESLADQLWAEWSTRHGRGSGPSEPSQPVSSGRRTTQKRDRP